MTAERYRRILQVVAAIPPGRVMSYGEVARRAGFPRGARLAAAALRGANEPGLPWHRVVRADGRIALAPGSPAFREQARRLRAEGWTLRGTRLARDRTLRDPDLDRALWGPD